MNFQLSDWASRVRIRRGVAPIAKATVLIIQAMKLGLQFSG